TVLQIDEYEDVTETLKAIEYFYRRKSIFVAGSAEDFSPWGEPAVTDFFRALGVMLVDSNFRIVSGFGLGVGNALISGAIDRAYSNGNYHLDDFLDVRPFPRTISDVTRRTEVWDAYRRDLLSLPGIAIFLFGNKVVDDQLVEADGMRKEFEIARSQGVLVIPIGGTGSLAKSLGEEVLKNFNDYFSGGDTEIKDALIKLQQPEANLNDYLERIISAIKKLAD
ncbi:MAG: hypothetical protein O9249_00170, partial [Burkholderiaceae bacterium]|nr:hypothetical protein [Burkholderiaceae bacterium]